MERGNWTENIRTDYGTDAAGFQDFTSATLWVHFDVFTGGKYDFKLQIVLKVSGFR